jgi:hypothetical protein
MAEAIDCRHVKITLLKNPEAVVDSSSFMSGSIVHFMRNGLMVDVVTYPYNIPSALSRNIIVKQEIIEPVRESVGINIRTIEYRLIPKLKELNRRGIINDVLRYDIEGFGREFKIYDASGWNNRLFQRVLECENRQIIPVGLEECVKLARFIKTMDMGRDSNEGYYGFIEGDTLKEAVERAITIYSNSEALKKVPLN